MVTQNGWRPLTQVRAVWPKHCMAPRLLRLCFCTLNRWWLISSYYEGQVLLSNSWFFFTSAGKSQDYSQHALFGLWSEKEDLTTFWKLRTKGSVEIGLKAHFPPVCWWQEFSDRWNPWPLAPQCILNLSTGWLSSVPLRTTIRGLFCLILPHSLCGEMGCGTFLLCLTLHKDFRVSNQICFVSNLFHIFC